MPDAIDYHRGPSEAERQTARRRMAAKRDSVIRWLVILIALLVLAVSIFLYTFPARLIDGNGYTR